MKEWVDPWEKYFNRKSEGAFDFMMDMGRALIERGIRMDWKDINDDSQCSPWMCQVCTGLTSFGLPETNITFVLPESHVTETLQAMRV